MRYLKDIMKNGSESVGQQRCVEGRDAQDDGDRGADGQIDQMIHLLHLLHLPC